MRFLHLIRPVMCVLPEVASPDRKVSEGSVYVLDTFFISSTPILRVECIGSIRISKPLNSALITYRVIVTVVNIFITHLLTLIFFSVFIMIIIIYTDSIPRKGSLDHNHPLHLPRMLSNPNLRCPICQIIRSLLLDACDPCLESWYTYGTGYFTHCYVRTCHAIIGWKSYY